MINVDQITNELMSVDVDISEHSARLQRESSEISGTINKISNMFSDQPAGQELVSSLYMALQNVVNAESSICIARNDIQKCIHNMRS